MYETGTFLRLETTLTELSIWENVVGTLIVFLFFSQKIMKGLASGAVKG